MPLVYTGMGSHSLYNNPWHPEGELALSTLVYSVAHTRIDSAYLGNHCPLPA